VNLENNQPVKSDDNQEHSTKVDNSRRSFAKKSATIAPVILTLANRSAWANSCVFSGFQSFAIAAKLGKNLSHGAFTPPSGSGWKNSIGWFSQVNTFPSVGWPNGYIATRINPGNSSGKYQILNLSTGFWEGNYSATDSSIAKGFVNSLLPGSSDNRTIYTVLLTNSSIDKILLYKIASEFNKMISTSAIPFPNLTGEIFNINGQNISDYEIFYSSCI
jgi:hypothetical protein